MKEIELTKGRVSLVDDEDFEMLNQWNWCARKKGTVTYALRNVQMADKCAIIYMHRVILMALVEQEVDHKDGNSLNNQRSNLRIVSHGDNMHNRRKKVGAATSVYKGVCWHKSNKRWRATIRLNSRVFELGYFASELMAALAYDEAARRMFGEFCCVNFPIGNEQSCHREPT